MRVLITGATGFVGRHLVSRLASRGIECVTIGRNADTISSHHIKHDLLSSASFESVLSKVNPTHLIHLAWYTEHGRYWDSDLNHDWSRSTCQILDAFYRCGGRHAFISGTCAEYDWEYGYCVEGLTPTNPNTHYGIAKDATRRHCEQIKKKYGGTLGWGRIFYPFGTGESQSRLIPSLFRVFKKRQQAFGVNCNVYRDFLYVSDVADAIVCCVLSNYDGPVNISSGNAIRLEELVREIASICNADPDAILRREPHNKMEPRYIVGANQRLRTLGWMPSIGFRAGLEIYHSQEKNESV